MKKAEILRRRNMWWLRYLRALDGHNHRRIDVVWKNYVYWARRFDFRFCNLRLI